jgi:hypothetical protein
VNQVKRISSPNSPEHCVLVKVKLRGKRFVKVLNLIGVQIDHDINILGRARDAM